MIIKTDHCSIALFALDLRCLAFAESHVQALFALFFCLLIPHDLEKFEVSMLAKPVYRSPARRLIDHVYFDFDAVSASFQDLSDEIISLLVNYLLIFCVVFLHDRKIKRDCPVS